MNWGFAYELALAIWVELGKDLQVVLFFSLETRLYKIQTDRLSPEGTSAAFRKNNGIQTSTAFDPSHEQRDCPKRFSQNNILKSTC